MFRRAGIPEFYWDLRPDHLKAYAPTAKRTKDEVLKTYKALLERGLSDNMTVVAGHLNQAKVVGYLFLKAILRHQVGAVVSLEGLTEWFLQDDKKEFKWIRDIPVLELQCGEEYAPQGSKLSIHKHLLNHLVEYRGEPRFRTVLVTNRTPTTIEDYGPALLRVKKCPWLQIDPELQLELQPH